MIDYITISSSSSKPKYLQIVSSVIESIEKGKLKRGAQLPSINELANQQKTAKATVAKAYEELRQSGVIHSQHGKGFYVAKTTVKNKLNIFLLFDSLNPYKEVLYNALKNGLPQSTHFSIFFHHYNKTLFKELINNNLGNYNYYLVMAHFDEDVSAIVNAIPKDQLLLLDKDIPQLTVPYAAVFQDFEKDIFNGLENALSHLRKYKKLHLVLGVKHFQYVPKGLVRGFKHFAKKSGLHLNILDNLTESNIVKGDAYLIFSDTDMITFIKYVNSKKLDLGKNIGLISYDDTPLKEILMDGITVITTDFEKMGKMAAQMILDKKQEKIANSSRLIIRKSL